MPSAASLVLLVAVSAATPGAVAKRPPQAALVVYQTAASSIAVVRADGSGRHQLPLGDGLNYSQPSLSPDGSRLAFTSVAASGGSPSFIRLSRLYGKEASAIRNPENIDIDGPRWSPDGRLIAFNALHGRVEGRSHADVVSAFHRAPRSPFRVDHGLL
jgi:dipeptidyl aminopeptidase/acylaminoacyl peptidase